MVHGIPCVDLPVAREETKYLETSLWERVKGSRVLRERKQLKISSPIQMCLENEESSSTLIPPKPFEKDEKYLRPRKSGVRQSSIRLEVITSPGFCTIRDVSPSFKMSNVHSPTTPFNESESSPVSARRKLRDPGMTKIPEDLTWCERYNPFTRSQPAHVLGSQTWSPTAGPDVDASQTGEDPEWSDGSSIYSQESVLQLESYLYP
jgi:hypothetical protein